MSAPGKRVAVITGPSQGIVPAWWRSTASSATPAPPPPSAWVADCGPPLVREASTELTEASAWSTRLVLIWTR